MMNTEMKVSLTFELDKAVCNHGFFMMAPNRWNPSTKTLTRPLRLPNHCSVTVSISQPCSTVISITAVDDAHPRISPSHQEAIVVQVKRMLRLSEQEDDHIKEFHRLHLDAAKQGFGRLFRNPSIFEDIVKTLLLCGCRFKQSLEMAEELCRVQKRLNRRGKRGRRKKESCHEAWGNFPSAQELASLTRKKLENMNCNLGYRADTILKLANDVTTGEIKLLDFESISDADELHRKLKQIKGIANFVSYNVLMCMGFYHKLPVDSETVRHIKEIHQREECVIKNAEGMIKEIYDKYAPYQTLAYWLELVMFYESRLGKLSLLDAADYKSAAGSFINKHA